MKRIPSLLAAVVVTLALISVPADAANFDWRDYADAPTNFGSYEFYHMRDVMPTFSCTSMSGDIPGAYFCTYSPWGSYTSDGKVMPTNCLVNIPVGSVVQVSIPPVSGIWTLSCTVDAGQTWTDKQVKSDGSSSLYLDFAVPVDGYVSYVLIGMELEKQVYMGDFDTKIRRNNALTGGAGSDLGGNLDSLNQEFPSLWPVFHVLDAVTMDTAALTTFGAIWAALIPTNGTMYVLISVALAMGVLGFVLFGRR